MAAAWSSNRRKVGAGRKSLNEIGRQAICRLIGSLEIAMIQGKVKGLMGGSRS
jgi:hypothetical protein